VGTLNRISFITILPPETKLSKPSFAKEWVYTKKEIEAIDRVFDAEEIRGAKPRFWEDVNVGDKLKPVVDGPITAWSQAVIMQGFGICNLPMIEVRRQTPERVMIDPVTNIPHKSIEWHLWERSGEILGHYSTTVIAVTCENLMARLISNWMGDDGYMRRLYYRMLGNTPIGDTLFANGVVTKKYVNDNGDHLVDIDVWLDSVRGYTQHAATATVSLVSKEKFFSIT
jgi:hypothetical protein